MVRIRRDLNQGGAAWNDTLLWYAKAVAHLYARPITERTSWRYLAAIHGIDVPGWIKAGLLGVGEKLPPNSETDLTWAQCQHGTWFFQPWHRGYVAAFEAIIAKTVQDLGGPADWALPYWNYLNASDPASRDIPKPFTDPNLPDGSPNFLSKASRHGTSRLGPMPGLPRDITLTCQTYRYYTSAPGALGYGGGTTAFSHNGNLTGAVEGNPHNLVHLMVGGINDPVGFMSDPDYAGLDPIFWVHHCNIDRLWAAWLTKPDHIQENGATWRDGPTGRGFVMPAPDGTLASFNPGQTLPGQALAPTYDDLSRGTWPSALALSNKKVTPGGSMAPTFSDRPPPASRVLGSNAEAVTIGQQAKATTVSIAAAGAPSLKAMAVGSAPSQRYFLNLEGIRGAAPSGVLTVTVGTEGGTAHPADTVALFGLANASRGDGPHAGNGLGATIDITQAVGDILAAGGNLNALKIGIEQPDAAPGREITVGRVSVVAQDGD